MDNNAAIIAALDDSVLSEAIAEASDAAGIRALFAAQGIMITEKAAASAYSALERLRKTSLTSEDLQFLRRDVASLDEDLLGAYISILCMVKYRRCLF